MSNTLSQFGEDTAAQFLEHKGYNIIERNYHSPYGEIDIICKKDDLLILVEVKARKSHAYGAALDAITEQKREKIIKTAYHYLTKRELDIPIRFDVITLEYDNKRKDYELKHIKNAFLGEDY
ncbi:MAG TPA: YraN family protein [Candidatus Cloacimonetes bacterium]|nr:YraN family protein [Candidatus Cloacimonadota bacterium]